MKDRRILVNFLLCSLSKTSNFEHTSQNKLVKDRQSNRVKDFFISRTIPVTFCSSLLTLAIPIRSLNLGGDLLKMIASNNYNVDLVNLSHKQLMFEFAK